MKKIIFGTCIVFLLSINVWADDVKNVAVEILAKSSSTIKIPAGAELQLHEHSVINVGVLLSGELTVVAKDKKTLHLKADDSIVEVVNKAHYEKNEGTETAEIIVFYAGVETVSQ